MKTAEIHWDLFWQALSQQATERKNSWLGRWAFTDDRVRLSMQPARTDTDDPDSQAWRRGFEEPERERDRKAN